MRRSRVKTPPPPLVFFFFNKHMIDKVGEFGVVY